MPHDFDNDIISKAKQCNFAQQCLGNFDSAMCCEIDEKCSTFLMVTPASSFKSRNCYYCQVIKSDDKDIYICACPLRLEIFNKNGK